MKRFTPLLAIAFLAGTSGAADPPAPAGKLANPAYASWAKVPKGTAVTLKVVSDSAGQKSEVSMTSTLVELTADKATVEMVSVTKAGGQEFKLPPTKQEFERFVAAPPGYDPKAPPKPEGLVEQSDTTLKIAGTSYKAKYTKIKQTPAPGTEVVVESWTSDDVPGMVLKSSSSYAGNGVVSKSSTELVEVKKPGGK